MAADDLQERLLDQAREIERLKAKTSTTLSGLQFLTIIFVFPLLIAFTIMGVTITWLTLKNPGEVAPHLDIVLLALSVFSGPVTAFVAILGQALMAEMKVDKKTEGGE